MNDINIKKINDFIDRQEMLSNELKLKNSYSTFIDDQVPKSKNNILKIFLNKIESNDLIKYAILSFIMLLFSTILLSIVEWNTFSSSASDHLGRAYHHTYGLKTTTSNCSNNYGPYHFPEKLIPLCLLNILNGNPLPIYGDGKQIRDWLYVEDHCRGIDLIMNKGVRGETYNIGGNNEVSNNKIAEILIFEIDKKLGRKPGESSKLIKYVNDRLGHDKRYAIDNSKIKNELGWVPKHNFKQGIKKTIDWYLNKTL